MLEIAAGEEMAFLVEVVMDGRVDGYEFLQTFICRKRSMALSRRRNVTDDERYGDRFTAKALADRCLADAATAGVTIDDMDPEQGSVETIIYEATQNYVDAELEFWKKFAATPLHY